MRMMRVSPERCGFFSHDLQHLVLCNAWVDYGRSYQLSHLPPGHLLTTRMVSLCAVCAES